MPQKITISFIVDTEPRPGQFHGQGDFALEIKKSVEHQLHNYHPRDFKLNQISLGHLSETEIEAILQSNKPLEHENGCGNGVWTADSGTVFHYYYNANHVCTNYHVLKPDEKIVEKFVPKSQIFKE